MMKVEIIKALTGGLLTFVIVFCAIFLKTLLFADSHGPSADAASSEMRNVSAVAAEADRDQKITPVTESHSPRQKNVLRPDASWLQGSKADRGRFQPLLRSRFAPALQVNNWTNSKPLSEADREGHVVVVAFWSTWCQPCLKSIEFNNQLHQYFKDRDVMVIGVCNRQGSEDMDHVVKTKNLKYPVAIDDPGDKSINAFKVKALPTYFVIDKEGRLRFADIKRSRIDDAVEYLLNNN